MPGAFIAGTDLNIQRHKFHPLSTSESPTSEQGERKLRALYLLSDLFLQLFCAKPIKGKKNPEETSFFFLKDYGSLRAYSVLSEMCTPERNRLSLLSHGGKWREPCTCLIIKQVFPIA